MYYKETQGVLICFDITDTDSFDAIQFWFNDVANNAPKDSVKVLVGLKLDLSGNRMVTIQQAKNLAHTYHMQYFEVSAKSGKGVDELFTSTVH